MVSDSIVTAEGNPGRENASSSVSVSTSQGVPGPSSATPNLPATTQLPPAKRTKTEAVKLSPFVDSISKENIERVDRLLARAVYAGGLPLSVFENNPYFEKALKALRPAYPGPPNIHMLRNAMLGAEFAVAQGKCKEKLSSAECLTFMTDGWANRNGEGVINFVFATPETVFHSAITPKDGVENADFISKHVLKVIEEVGAEKVLLFLADNARVMGSVAKIVKGKYPHIFTLGCSAHILNLLDNDVVKIGYFEDIKSRAVEVAKLKRKRVILAELRLKQKD